MSRIDRTNLAIFVGIVVFAVFSLWALLWLQQRFEQERADRIAAIKENFSFETLGPPEDIEDFRFSDLERIDRRLLENNAYVRQIVVAKMVRTDTGLVEHILHPFDYKLKNRDWRAQLATLERHPLERNGAEYGAVYFNFDYSRRNSVRGALAALAVLTVIVLAVVGRRLRVQEVALTRTTVELQERKRELVELERFSLAGQISANIFHDIRKPILNIRMDVEELEGDKTFIESARERVEDMRRQIDLFFSILRDLNIERFIRGDQSEREYVDVNDLLDRSCALVRYERGGVELATDYTPSPPPVFGFPYRLILVFSNIILNAYQAMGGNGKLRLVTRREAESLVVRIEDTGPGIDPGHVERVFEPFFSTRQREGGSGLGLYICKGIIEDLGGSIDVRSTPGEGTSFEIRLPVSADDEGKSEAPRGGESGRSPGS